MALHASCSTPLQSNSEESTAASAETKVKGGGQQYQSAWDAARLVRTREKAQEVLTVHLGVTGMTIINPTETNAHAP